MNANGSQSPGPSLAWGVGKWKMDAFDPFECGESSHSDTLAWMGQEIGQGWPQVFRIDSKRAQRAETGANHSWIRIRQAPYEYGQRREPYRVGFYRIRIVVKPRTCRFPDFAIRAAHGGQKDWHNFMRAALNASKRLGCVAPATSGGLRFQEHSAKLVRDHSGRGFEVSEEETRAEGELSALRTGYRVADRRKRPEKGQKPERIGQEFLSPGRRLVVHPL